jgi:hypothetical protein
MRSPAQHLLENMDADESIEFTANLFEGSNVNEAHTHIEMQTFLASLGDSGKQSVKS